MIDYLEISKIGVIARQKIANDAARDAKAMEYCDRLYSDPNKLAEYRELEETARIYSMTTTELIEAHKSQKNLAEYRQQKELQRLRNNIVLALDLARQAKSPTSIYHLKKEHNLDVARDIIRRNWSAYRIAKRAGEK